MVFDVWHRPSRSIFPCRETDATSWTDPLSVWFHIEPCLMWESLAKRDGVDRNSFRSDWGSWHWASILWAIQQSCTTTIRSYSRSKIARWRDRVHIRWWKDCSEWAVGYGCNNRVISHRPNQIWVDWCDRRRDDVGEEARSSNQRTQVPEDDGSTSEQRMEQWRGKRNSYHRLQIKATLEIPQAHHHRYGNNGI